MAATSSLFEDFVEDGKSCELAVKIRLFRAVGMIYFYPSPADFHFPLTNLCLCACSDFIGTHDVQQMGYNSTDNESFAL